MTVTHLRATQLTSRLQEIQRLTAVLNPLVDDGRPALEQFRRTLDEILERIAPTYTVALVGPVSSGKSTLLSSLVREGGDDSIASISPSNETFAPMCLKFGPVPTLTVHFFGVDVLQQISERLEQLQQNAEPAHMIATYRELRNVLRTIPAVVAGDPDRTVVKDIPLAGLSRHQLADTIRRHIAHSSSNPDVYGIYRVDLAYPGNTLKELHNARLVDLFGFGEPNPLVSIKFSRFTAQEPIDFVVYVFPNRAVTDDFNRLFELPGLVEQILQNNRLILVLNKADAYTDAGPREWPRVVSEFRDTLAKHIPALRPFVRTIPIHVMSAASIDNARAVGKRNIDDIRRLSMQSLHNIRDSLRTNSEVLQGTSQDPSLHLGSLFDLLGLLETLARGAEDSLQRIQDKVPAIPRLIDEVSARHVDFQSCSGARLEVFRAALQQKVEQELDKIDFEKSLLLDKTGLPLGNPLALFRSMLSSAEECAKRIFVRNLVQALQAMGRFTIEQMQHAYQAYASQQDTQTRAQLDELTDSSQRRSMQAFEATVGHSAKDLLNFVGGTSLHMQARTLFERFANWHLRNRGEWGDAAQAASLADVREQIILNVRETVRTFMLVFVCDAQPLAAGYRSQVCIGGEPTFWQHTVRHIGELDSVLGQQVRITTWRLGLYKNKEYFVSRQPEYQEVVTQLLAKRAEAVDLILEMV